MRSRGRSPVAGAVSQILLTCVVALFLAATGHADERRLFITSAVEHGDDTVTLPLYRGTSGGRIVWYVLLDASSDEYADAFGVNRAQKLENARGTIAVQKVRVERGAIEFPATVDFRPERNVVAGAQGFPPLAALPGAVADPGYSPLIQLPNGTILNAPHVANDTGQADKVVRLDIANRTVTYVETLGFQGGRGVRYLSTDASDPVVAALENVTFAPLLNHAPFAGGDSTNSSRASLAAFLNGQTGIDSPERQGLNSALLDGRDPLNVLFWAPNQGRYSPLWDVFAVAWQAAAVARNQNVRQTDFGQVLNLAQKGTVTGPGGAPFGPAGFVVNCPIVSRE